MQPVTKCLVGLQLCNAKRYRNGSIRNQFIDLDERPQLFGEICGTLDILSVNNDDEFFAADTIQAVRNAYAKGYDFSNALQDQITGGVAMHVIDLLEVINIEKNQRYRQTHT